MNRCCCCCCHRLLVLQAEEFLDTLFDKIITVLIPQRCVANTGNPISRQYAQHSSQDDFGYGLLQLIQSITNHIPERCRRKRRTRATIKSNVMQWSSNELSCHGCRNLGHGLSLRFGNTVMVAQLLSHVRRQHKGTPNDRQISCHPQSIRDFGNGRCCRGCSSSTKQLCVGTVFGHGGSGIDHRRPEKECGLSRPLLTFVLKWRFTECTIFLLFGNRSQSIGGRIGCRIGCPHPTKGWTAQICGRVCHHGGRTGTCGIDKARRSSRTLHQSLIND